MTTCKFNPALGLCECCRSDKHNSSKWNCVAIPASFELQVRKAVDSAVDALWSGEDFRPHQRSEAWNIATRIYEDMANTTSIPRSSLPAQVNESHSLEEFSRRLNTAEKEITRLHDENVKLRADVKALQTTVVDLQTVADTLLDPSTNDQNSKKRKTCSPPLMTPQSGLFRATNSFPLQHATTSTTPGTGIFSNMSPVVTSAPNASVVAPASTTPSLFGNNNIFAPTGKAPSPVNLFASLKTLASTQASGSPQSAPASTAPPQSGSTANKSLPGSTLDAFLPTPTTNSFAGDGSKFSKT
ncbi:MAG: hypothetical protein L6R42_007643 [Xanthoria sp. 1 TBL-2021]|nr:MAG: hypothetical protein L6R42_007643 [Xanthoria sp. 1 TBL-2021]